MKTKISLFIIAIILITSSCIRKTVKIVNIDIHKNVGCLTKSIRYIGYIEYRNIYYDYETNINLDIIDSVKK